MFEELPNPDRLWNLLNLIILCRSCSELELEEELHDYLIYIHRDPNLLINLTGIDLRSGKKDN